MYTEYSKSTYIVRKYIKIILSESMYIIILKVVRKKLIGSYQYTVFYRGKTSEEQATSGLKNKDILKTNSV